MKRKGDLSIQTIVIAALSMIVLLILIFIFKDQIGNLAGGFRNAGDSARGNINGTRCQSLIGNRYCNPSSSTYPTSTYNWDTIPPPPSGWSDCKTGQCVEITPK